MATWGQFAEAAPEMAAAGAKRLDKVRFAYLATVRKDGAPRVHPVCPFIASGRLFIVTAPDSPKRLDLLRDGRYVVHLLPGKNDAEFSVRGRGQRVTDDATRTMAIEVARSLDEPAGGLNVNPEDWLFEYGIEAAATAYWENVGQPNTYPVRHRWVEGGPHGGPPGTTTARIPPVGEAAAVTWADFGQAAPTMVARGGALFEKYHIAFLATVRRDGAPRVHPVSPIIGEGRLFTATPPTSPKRIDLAGDGRYVLHALPGEGDGEFLIRGRASRVTDEPTRALITDSAGHTVRPHDWLFEYAIESAATTEWERAGQPDTRPIRRRWLAGGG